MITPELLDFIEAELRAGQTQERLLRLLRESGGWTDADIEEAMVALEKRKRPVSIGQMRAQGSSPILMPGHATGPVVPLVTPPKAEEKPQPKPEPALRMGEMIHAPSATPPASTPPPTPSAVVQTPAPTLPPTPSPTLAHSPSSTPSPLPASIFHPPTPSISLTLSSHTPSPIPALVHGGVGESLAIAATKGASVLDVPDTSHQHGTSLRMPVSSTKKILIGVGVFAFLTLFGIGGFFLVKGLAPKEDKVLATMYASIPGIQSLRYEGEMTINLSGKVTDTLAAGFPDGYAGSAKVAFKYDGRADLRKGVDGVHQFGITADLQSGESQVAIKSSIELRIIGDTYYIKITNPPEIKDIDLSRLESYWVAVTPLDIAKRFGGGVDEATNTYGSFGGTASTTQSVRGVIAANAPLSSLERIGEEQVGGAKTIHYRFAGDPERLFALLAFIVPSMTGTPWSITEGEAQNIKALLAELKGDIWIDSASYLPRKIVFRHPLRGIVSGITLDGVVDVEQQYSEYNGNVSVSAPRPVITYDEFADDVRRQIARIKATGDAKRVFDAEDIAQALEVYRANHDDAYPITLDALVTDGLLKEIPKDSDGGTYLYTPFISKEKTTKKSLCTTATSTCAFFHLGVTLATSSATTTAEALERDSDLLSEMISGADTKGCTKESGKACYDLTPQDR